MAHREMTKADRAAHMARLEAENARLRRLAAELAGDVGDLQASRGVRRSDGAVDPALRLLVGVPPQH
jgi:anti-sigma factor RsiW